MTTSESRGYRSIFWPILLIGGGAIWLLANLGLIAGWSWWNLWRLWPLFLIAIGLDLLFARRSPILGALLGLVTVGAAILLLTAAPSLGLPQSPGLPSWFGPAASAEIVTETFSEPIGLAETAEVELDLSVADSAIEALAGGDNLIEAEISHIGEIGFTVSGETSKNVHLYQVSEPFGFRIDWPEGNRLRWDVGLTGAIPLDLSIDCGVGKADIDLSDLQIVDLNLDIDVGDIVLSLPAMESAYEATINGGVGRLEIRIENGAAIALDVRGDVGHILIDVPDDAAVRVQADTDVGDVRVPSSFDQTRSGGEQFVGESGTWETSGFADAERTITIVFNGGVGNLTVR
ncbi:MAG: hypothetical protein A2Y93_14835 [Chloroflexi bacterium RBG_13_68_17]|nr:MAG: hypothetical protein A2Y93_14835 [Chloroflexi bacterium RBG_13_68_17]